MKPLRRHVALAIDGGGLRGTMVARALAIVEASMGRPWHELVDLAAGTSTGSVLSAGIALRFPAAELHDLYVRLGPTVFKRTLRFYWLFSRYRFSNKPLIDALREYAGERYMEDLWKRRRPFDLVITVRDLVENRTRFVKSWKPEYARWKVWYAVLCSSTVPMLFPVVDGRYVDGGVGAFTNPCYVCAYEAIRVLGWDPNETTLISLGTGRAPGGLQPYQANRFFIWDWLSPLLDTLMGDSNDQQVRLVQQIFPDIDFRRFQVEMDPLPTGVFPSEIPALTQWGDVMGEMILNDQVDTKVLRPAGRP